MLQLPLNALRTFEAVAKALSFTRGAEALNVSPAAVSSQIRTLEERLKQPLFKRQGRQVTLTDAGQLLLPGVQRGLDELRRAVQTLDLERNEGVLNVSMGPTFLQKWIMPRMNDFYRKHHGIDLRINADDTPVKFENSDFHAAIVFGPDSWPGLESVKLLDDWILPVCSKKLLKKIGPITSIDDLQKHDLLFVEHESWDAWFRVVGESGRDRRWSLLNDSVSILMAAEQGQAIALSRWSSAARDIKARRLVRPIETVVKTDWSYYFVAPAHYFNMPKVAVFREWLQQQCSVFELPVDE
jgi:LysR family glycine cleavage system transcriptional activator